ncbi:unnamed protein product [Darwinula stevensoni]|uniref:nicotinamidase n=1 Tax=Darwinula stevensoni TaxID=69355 RepID=A0A7R9A3W7_9CRUS|nr:unnamed protein product [Darwinula stevensoni]CAG0891399.1 unnamed protein product [Darwinula stevensoni]
MDVSLQPHHLFFDELVKEVPDSEFGFVHRKSCFQTFDLDGDNLLSAAEFLELCRALFRTANSEFYGLDALQLVEIFTLFDTNKDGYIDSQEFVSCWEKWIRVICYPRCVLLVVDVQNDFISGTLALHRCPAGHRGEEVVPAINKLVETIPFHLVVYSLDWHPQNHVSFIDNVQLRDIHPTSKVCGEAAKEYDTVVFSGPPPMEQKLWPRHCVQGSLGSQLHPDLKVKDDAVFVHKGVNPEIDSYSAFWDNNKLSQTELHEELTKWDITDVFCCGIAYDVCVVEGRERGQSQSPIEQ